MGSGTPASRGGGAGDGGGLAVAARAALAAVVGEEHVHTGEPARAAHAGGLSYLDLVRRGLGGRHTPPLPDAVVAPAGPDEVQAVLTACREHDVAVVPFGGGTSVVGGVEALRGGKDAVVALDLRRLDRLVEVDEVARLATLQAGLTGPAAERLLAGVGPGYTLGHVPQSFERATIGGFAMTGSAGQASSGYGRFDELVHGLRLATPSGEWRLGRAPASAAGPDLRRLVLGSEGAFGVVTEVTVRVRPRPSHRRYEGLVLDGWERGVRAVRELAQAGALASVTRFSDPAETDLSLALAGGARGGAVAAATLRRAALAGYLRARRVREPCLLVLGWEAVGGAELAARRRATLRMLRPHRPVSLGAAAGQAWRRGRFAGPRQRDALMARGVCVETVETAAPWSVLPALAGAVRSALSAALAGPLGVLPAGAAPAGPPTVPAGPPAATPVVLCHVSHAYETGASLYFTVLVPRDERDPVGQWQRAKDAASAAIRAHGGTISHHHGVGVDHLPWLAGEIGEPGRRVLCAVKNTLDPTGILNPGKLIGH